MGTVALIGAALSALSSVMSKLPDYDQRKKEKFYKLKAKYENELNKVDCDDQLIDDLRDELRLFFEVFAEEIQG